MKINEPVGVSTFASGVELPLRIETNNFLQGTPLDSQEDRDRASRGTALGVDQFGFYDTTGGGAETAYINKDKFDDYITNHNDDGVIVKRAEFDLLVTALEKAIEGEEYAKEFTIIINRQSDLGNPEPGQYLVNEYLVLLPAFLIQVSAVKAFLVETATTGYGITNKDRETINAFDVASMDKQNTDFVQLAVAVEARNRIFSDSGTRWRSATIVSQITRRAQRLALHFIQTSILSGGSV
jgi:hypothetical protein